MTAEWMEWMVDCGMDGWLGGEKEVELILEASGKELDRGGASTFTAAQVLDQQNFPTNLGQNTEIWEK